jgi:Mn-dependent DtxR family transcriptional regulator
VTSELTALQAEVLAVVRDETCGPSRVAQHLLVRPSSARTALMALERRNYVSAVYTGIGVRGRHFTSTARGDEALLATFSEDTDE